MKPEALILIEDDLDAQKLVAAWPNVDLGELTPDEVRADEDEVVLRELSRVSGVDDDVARRLYPVLLVNGICLPDGTVAPMAEQLVKKKVADGLK